jgi:hypothetical protein
MSFIVTLLLIVVSFVSLAATLMSVRAFDSKDGFAALLLTFVGAVAVDFYVDFPNPNGFNAVRFALLAAVVAPMIWLTLLKIGRLVYLRIKG